ncbi:OapA N-terminal domain-containing protein [Paenibacillus senegalensis]
MVKQTFFQKLPPAHRHMLGLGVPLT